MRKFLCLMVFTYVFCCSHFCCSQEVYSLAPKESKINYYPDIEAKNAICVDLQSGRILYYKNPFEKVSIASTTKIMTSILALENANLNDVYEVSNQASWIEGSTMGIKKGEKYKLTELLYGLMLKSGNDAAVTIAQGISGSVENFAELMNQKALSLGMDDSHFVTPHGLDSDEHYSTAFDMYKLTKYALSNKEFCNIVRTKSINIRSKTLVNTNPFLEYYVGVDGVKTGYTGKAGRCLVISAARGDMKIVTVILNCSSSKTRLESGKKIMDYVFSNFKQYKLMSKDEIVAQVPVIKGKSSTAQGIASDDFCVPLTAKERENILKTISTKEKLKAPVSAENEIGEIKFSLSGDFERSINIHTKENVDQKKIIDYFLEIISIWLKELI